MSRPQRDVLTTRRCGLSRSQNRCIDVDASRLPTWTIPRVAVTLLGPGLFGPMAQRQPAQAPVCWPRAGALDSESCMWIAEMTGDGDGQAIFQSRSLSWPHQQPAEALVHWGSSGAWVGSVSHKHHHSAEFGLGRQRGGGGASPANGGCGGPFVGHRRAPPLRARAGFRRAVSGPASFAASPAAAVAAQAQTVVKSVVNSVVN